MLITETELSARNPAQPPLSFGDHWRIARAFDREAHVTARPEPD